MSYQSDYSGAQVDEAVGKALNPDATPTDNSTNLVESGGVYDALAPLRSVDAVPTPSSTNLVQSGGVYGVMSNRNLLDNPWFTVNQRNAPNGTTIGHLAYGVDRWFGAGASYKPNADGVIVDGVICQKFENTAWLIGKTVTVSVLYANGTISYGTGTFAVGTITLGDGGQVAIPTGASQVNFAPGDKTKVVRALKLELGSVSTLANDAPPNFAEELAKCQRYFYRYSGLATAYTCAGSTVSAITIPFPVTMRSVPAISNITHYDSKVSEGQGTYVSSARFYNSSNVGFSVTGFNVSADL